MKKPAAILFDLDGTLLTTGGAGRKAMDAAIREIAGLAEGLGTMRLDGMTDRGIVREAVHAHGRTCSEDEIDRVLARYLELLEHGISACAEYTVLPGVVEAVQVLRGRGLAVGLGTGNVEKGARIKLERSGLNPHLPFGGFGCDAEDRAALLAKGVERAQAIAGRELSGDEVWIVGDTPRDIVAARKIGARVLAVATGHWSVDELRAHAPDAVVPDLSHATALVHLGGR